MGRSAGEVAVEGKKVARDPHKLCNPSIRTELGINSTGPIPADLKAKYKERMTSCCHYNKSGDEQIYKAGNSYCGTTPPATVKGVAPKRGSLKK